MIFFVRVENPPLNKCAHQMKSGVYLADSSSWAGQNARPAANLVLNVSFHAC